MSNSSLDSWMPKELNLNETNTSVPKNSLIGQIGGKIFCFVLMGIIGFGFTSSIVVAVFSAMFGAFVLHPFFIRNARKKYNREISFKKWADKNNWIFYSKPDKSLKDIYQKYGDLANADHGTYRFEIEGKNAGISYFGVSTKNKIMRRVTIGWIDVPKDFDLLQIGYRDKGIYFPEPESTYLFESSEFNEHFIVNYDDCLTDIQINQIMSPSTIINCLNGTLKFDQPVNYYKGKLWFITLDARLEQKEKFVHHLNYVLKNLHESYNNFQKLTSRID